MAVSVLCFFLTVLWIGLWYVYSKACVKRPLSKRPKIGFQDQLSLNADQKYILLTFIKLPIVIKIFVLSIFEWSFYTGFTVSGISWLCSLAFI